MPSSRPISGRGAARGFGGGDAALRRAALRWRSASRDPRPRRIRAQPDLAVEHARDALDDREAEPHAARHPRALIEPLEFLEDGAALGLRNADAGVVHLDAQLVAAPAAADQHVALAACI